MARLIYSEHPLGMDRREVEVSAGVTVREALKSAGASNRSPWVARIDGVPAKLDAGIPAGSLVTATAVAQDVGGGGGSNPLTAILSLASFAIPGIGPVVGFILRGVITFAGGLLIQALFGKKNKASEQSRPQLEDPSPIYSIEGSRNNARRHQPMAIVFGTHRLVPDLAAQPFTEFQGHEQFLTQMFHLGLSEVFISDFRIGDTDIANYPHATWEVSPYATGAITRYPNNVDSTEGVALDDTQWHTRTTSTDTTAFVIDIEHQHYSVNEQTGQYQWNNTRIDMEWRAAGTSDPWSKIFPDGIDIGNDNGDIRREGFWQAVPQGQYDVRVRRRTAPDTDSAIQDQITWTQLKSYQPDLNTYEFQTRLALRVKATGELSGVINNFSLKCEAAMPTSTTPGAPSEKTSNPAWQILWLARGKRDNDGERMYGALLEDDQIDMDSINAFAAFCDLHNLTCNMVVQGAISTNDLMETIARCGRGTMSWGTGKLGVVFEDPATLPTQVFGMPNIKLDSFNVQYVSEKVPEQLIATYNDEAQDWKQGQVVVTTPGVTAPERVVEINLEGVTNATLASREANLIVARQFYARRRITFATDIEGLVAHRGDVIQLSHDLTKWGYSGRLLATNRVQHTLNRTIDELEAGKDHYMTFRHVDGSTETVPIIYHLPGSNEVSTATISHIPDPAVDTVWMIDADETPGKLARIVSVKPKGLEEVQIECIDESAEYHASETNPSFLLPPPDALVGRAEVVRVSFSETLVVVDLTRARVFVSVETRNATSFILEHKRSTEHAYREAITVFGSSWIEFLPPGLYDFRITPYRAGLTENQQGPAWVGQFNVQGANAPPPDVAVLTAARIEQDVQLNWTRVTVVDFKEYQIRKGSSWNNSVLVGVTNSNLLRVMDPQGGAYRIKAVDLSGNESVNDTEITVPPYSNINVVYTSDEPPWDGTHDNTEEIAEGITLVTGQNIGTYTLPEQDIGIEVTSAVAMTFEAAQIAIDPDTWAAWTLPWSNYGQGWTWAGPLQSDQVLMEWRFAADDYVWSDWIAFSPGIYDVRYYQFRANLIDITPDNNYKPLLVSVATEVDVPDRLETFESQYVPEGGITLAYKRPFVIIPSITANVVSSAQQTILDISNKTPSGLHVRLEVGSFTYDRETDNGDYDLGTGAAPGPTVQVTGLSVSPSATLPIGTDVTINILCYVHAGRNGDPTDLWRETSIDFGLGLNGVFSGSWLQRFELPQNYAGVADVTFEFTTTVEVQTSDTVDVFVRRGDGAHGQCNPWLYGTGEPANPHSHHIELGSGVVPTTDGYIDLHAIGY